MPQQIKHGFKLCHQGKLYSQDEINLKIAEVARDSACLAVISEARFSTVLYLLYGWLYKKLVFPVSADFSKRAEQLCQASLLTQKDNFILAIATSGSLSEPKIALISEYNIISHCRSLVKRIPLDKKSVWLNCLPLNHIAGVMIVYRCWLNNAVMLLHDDFNVQKIWADLQQFSVSHISLVPKMLASLLDYADGRQLPASLKFIIVGGDKLSESLLLRVKLSGWPVMISYGMTEACSTIALGETPQQLTPLDGFHLQLDHNSILSISGDMLISAYAQGDTDGCYINSNAFNQTYFKTSDQVNWDGKFLSILGRNDNMLISGGKNISPEYIESLLGAYAGIDDVAVGKIPHEEWGDTIVVLFSGDEGDFKYWIEAHIPREYQPRVLYKVAQIPRNSMGKIDRKSLQILIDKKP